MTRSLPVADRGALERVARLVDPLATAFADAGYRLYLVGGVVRDLTLGAHSTGDDIDLTTDAHPDVIKQLVSPLASAMWSPGERFGTVAASVGNRHLEITTHRAESYDPSSRKPVVTFGHSIDQDLARRDFTINAMALSLPDHELRDPHRGLDDLAAGVLRTPLAPEVAFGDDPLRMLRAARFLPRFGLEPEVGLESAATALAERLSIVSAERIRDELERLLAVPAPEAGIRFLQRTRLLDHVVPALVEQSHDLGEGGGELVEVACVAASGRGSPLARRAALLASLGGRGAAATMRRLRYGRNAVRATTALIEVIDGVVAPPPVPAETVRRVVDRIGLERVADLRQLAENLARARGDAAAAQPFFERFSELDRAEDLSRFEPPLSGGEVIDELQIEPGPQVGQAVDYLRQERLRRGPIAPEIARELVRHWWDRQVTRANQYREIPATGTDGSTVANLVGRERRSE